jgi:hypothetical protein
LASEVTNLSNYYTKGEIDILDAPTGLKKVVPSSVAVGSGSGSVSASGTVTFSGASSVALNGVFSSNYTNYKIVFNATSGSGALYIRLRANNSDNSSAVYSNYSHYGRSGNANAVLTANENATEAAMVDNMSSASYDTIDIFNPNVNTNTSAHFQGLHIAPGTSGYRVMAHWGGWNHNTNYQADGITLYAGSSMTGNLTVYGYTN